MPSWRWRTIEHTADLAVEVEAASVAELFLACGDALVGVLVGCESSEEVDGDPATGDVVTRRLDLEAPDREAMLIEWMRELLHLANAEGLLFAGGEFAELEDERLEADVELMSLQEARPMERELKGVTYHDLALDHRDGGWYARVVFDL